MDNLNFRIESSDIMVGPLLPEVGTRSLLVRDIGLATVVAAKSITKPYGHEIRVVLVSTGEVVYRKTAAFVGSNSD